MFGIIAISVNPHDKQLAPIMEKLVRDAWGPGFENFNVIEYLQKADYVVGLFIGSVAPENLKGVVAVTQWHGCPDDDNDTRPFMTCLAFANDLPVRLQVVVARRLYKEAVQYARSSPARYRGKLYATTDNLSMLVGLRAIGLSTWRPRWWWKIGQGDHVGPNAPKEPFKILKIYL